MLVQYQVVVEKERVSCIYVEFTLTTQDTFLVSILKCSHLMSIHPLVLRGVPQQVATVLAQTAAAAAGIEGFNG